MFEKAAHTHSPDLIRWRSPWRCRRPSNLRFTPKATSRKPHWDVRFPPFRSLALNRTSCTHSKIYCSRIHGCPPPWNVKIEGLTHLALQFQAGKRSVGRSRHVAMSLLGCGRFHRLQQTRRQRPPNLVVDPNWRLRSYRWALARDGLRPARWAATLRIERPRTPLCSKSIS